MSRQALSKDLGDSHFQVAALSEHPSFMWQRFSNDSYLLAYRCAPSLCGEPIACSTEGEMDGFYLEFWARRRLTWFSGARSEFKGALFLETALPLRVLEILDVASRQWQVNSDINLVFDSIFVAARRSGVNVKLATSIAAGRRSMAA